MTQPERGRVRTVLHRLWGFIDGTRRLVLNLLFAVAIALVAASFGGGTPRLLKERTVLVLDIHGPIVEQRSGSPRDTALEQLSGEDQGQTRLRDVIGRAGLARRSDAPRWSACCCCLEDFWRRAACRLSARWPRRWSASRPRASRWSAWATGFDQRQYDLAAHASEVYAAPHGGRGSLEGYGRLRNYYRGEALDRVGVSANVVRVGRYRNAGRALLRQRAVQGDAGVRGLPLTTRMWGLYTRGVEQARKLPAGGRGAPRHRMRCPAA
jgi:protease-4